MNNQVKANADNYHLLGTTITNKIFETSFSFYVE